MKTPEKLFTELAAGELVCPCETYCSARKRIEEKPSVINKTSWTSDYIVARHEQFEDFLGCLTFRLTGLICELIVQKRGDGTKNALPNNAYLFWVTDEKTVIPEWIYQEAVKKYGLQFSESYNEFERRVNMNLISICNFITERYQKVH